MYNRVGKCGSRATLTLLEAVAPRNNITLVLSDINNQKELSLPDQVDWSSHDWCVNIDVFSATLDWLGELHQSITSSFYLQSPHVLHWLSKVDWMTSSLQLCIGYLFIVIPRLGAVPLVHINIIRDPLTRFVSSYYYKRFGDGREHSLNFRGDLHQVGSSDCHCIYSVHIFKSVC